MSNTKIIPLTLLTVLTAGPFGAVNGFLAAPSLSLERTYVARSSVPCAKTGTTSVSKTRVHMTFLGSGQIEDTVAFGNTEEVAGPMDSSPSLDAESSSMEVTDYAVEQTRTSAKWFDQPTVLQGRIMALVAAAFYGTNFASIKILNDSLPVSLGASLRFGIGALAVSTVVLASERARDEKEAAHQYFQVYDAGEEVFPVSKAELYKERTDATFAGFEVGLWYSVGCIVQAIALLEVDASKSAFFNAAAILVVPLLDMVFKNKKLGLPGAISIGLAMFGMGLLQLGGVEPGADMTFRMSDALCACQAIAFGVGYWRLEHHGGKFPNQAGRITMGQLLGVASGAFTYSVAMGIVPPLEAILLTLYHLPMLTASLLWTGLGATAVALYLETVAIKAISATELTILMTSVSLWGSAFAYITMGEVLSPTGMAGGALLLGGCLVSTLMGEKEVPHEASFVLGEDEATTLVMGEATEYESIEEAIASSEWDMDGTSYAGDGATP